MKTERMAREGYLAPRSATLEEAEDRCVEAAALVAQAIQLVDSIREAAPQGLYPSYRNLLDRPRDKRPYNMKDAKREAANAARLLREAWDILDPSL